jgi:hypothetical protein
MSDELSKPQRRALQYWYVDGTYELGFGLFCLILATYFQIERLLEGSWLSAVADASLVLVFLGGGALIRWLTRKWKERVTFPRTGYISYRRETGLRRGVRIALGLFVGLLIGATVAVLVTQPFQDFDIMPLVSGLLLGVVLAILAWRTSLPRLYLLAAFSTGTGLALAFARLGNYTALSLYYLVLGLGLIASGLVTLVRYLRNNPLPVEASDGQ